MSENLSKHIEQSKDQPPSTARQNVLVWLFSTSARPVRFILTGGFCGLLQLLFMELLTHLHCSPIIANLVAFFLAAQLNFLLSLHFTWRDRQNEPYKSLFRHWLSFHGSILGTALLNQSAFMLARLAMPDLLASILGISCAALANFLIMNRFVFCTTFPDDDQYREKGDQMRYNDTTESHR